MGDEVPSDWDEFTVCTTSSGSACKETEHSTAGVLRTSQDGGGIEVNSSIFPSVAKRSTV